MLTESEWGRLLAFALEHVRGRVPVLAGTGAAATAASVQQTRRARALGADAALVVTPYYVRPTQQGLLRHFTEVAEHGGLPIVMYNVPSRTVTNMLPETTVRLSEIENIVGVKEASGNFEGIAKIIQNSRPGFLVYSGDDSSTLPILSLGGYGIVSVASHLIGKQIQRMIGHFRAGEVDAAAKLHRELLPLVNALFVVTNPIPLKYALNKVGFRVGKPRLPLVEIDPKLAAIVDAALASATIDLPL